MRDIDHRTTERYATPSLLLMEAAAAATLHAIAARFPEGLQASVVAVFCGRGNNGGDGAALARALCLRGALVDVVLFGRFEETRGDARANFEIVRRLARDGVLYDDLARTSATSLSLHDHSGGQLTFVECTTSEQWEHFLYSEPNADYDLIIDALFGTGLTRPLAGVPQAVVRHLQTLRMTRDETNGRPTPLLLSLDLPSGLNADSAELIGPAVQADITVTFTAPKPANVLPPAAHHNGELVVADIGSPLPLLDEADSQLFVADQDDAREWLRLTRYAPDSYKQTHGHALLVAGSRQMSGAAVLCGDAALRVGAGLVTVATSASAQAAVAARVLPEIMVAALPETNAGALDETAFAQIAELASRCHVVAIGPGLSSDDEGKRRLVRRLVAQRTTPLVIDADGLNALAPWPADLGGSDQLPLVLTPHLGEMRRLLGAKPDDDTLTDRVRAAREFATAHHVILVLKGARALTAAPDGRVCVNPTGNAGLGTAGAGDTLTGIIAGFLAQAYGTLGAAADPFLATVAALYVGGTAGDLAAHDFGMRTMTASDIREHLSAAVRKLDPEGERP